MPNPLIKRYERAVVRCRLLPLPGVTGVPFVVFWRWVSPCVGRLGYILGYTPWIALLTSRKLPAGRRAALSQTGATGSDPVSPTNSQRPLTC